MRQTGGGQGRRAREAADAAGLAPVLMAPAIMASIWQMMLGEERAPDLAAMSKAHVDLVLRGLLQARAPGQAPPAA